MRSRGGLPRATGGLPAGSKIDGLDGHSSREGGQSTTAVFVFTSTVSKNSAAPPWTSKVSVAIWRGEFLFVVGRVPVVDGMGERCGPVTARTGRRADTPNLYTSEIKRKERKGFADYRSDSMVGERRTVFDGGRPHCRWGNMSKSAFSFAVSGDTSLQPELSELRYSPESSLEFRLPLLRNYSRSLRLEALRPSFGETLVVGVPGFLAEISKDFKQYIHGAVGIDPNYTDPGASHPSAFLGWKEWIADLVSVLEDSLVSDPYLKNAKKIVFLADSMGIALSIAAFKQLQEKFPHLTADIIGTRVTFMGSARTPERMEAIYDRGIAKLKEDNSGEWRQRDLYRGIEQKERLLALLTIARELNREQCREFTTELDTSIKSFPGKIVMLVPPLNEQGAPGYDKTHPREAQEHLLGAATHGSVVGTLGEALAKIGLSDR